MALGTSTWDEQTTRQIIGMRAVKPKVGEGAYSRLVWPVSCRRPQDCGGECALARGHVGPCECAGDDPGHPGSCSA